MMTLLTLCVFLPLFFRGGASTSLTCLDNDGDPVDWFWVYKLNDGEKYAYYDSSSDVSKITPMTNGQSLAAGSNSCIERTTNQIYTNIKSINWLTYNDENAMNGSTDYTCGHSKGMIAFTEIDQSYGSDGSDTADEVSGFWMIHSVPKFPNMSLSSYEYPSNGIDYGQNFFCASLGTTDDINAASKQLQYITPWIWASNQMNKDTDSIENFNNAIDGKWMNGTSIVNITIAKVGNKNKYKNKYFNKKKDATSITSFEHLARSGSENLDIFEGVIAVEYEQGFEWETWQHSSYDEPVYCPPQYTYEALDIQKLTLGNGYYVENEDDHSKFGISVKSQTSSKNINAPASQEIVCTGDLNRATSQNVRGGGYACLKDSSFYSVLASTITQVEQCKN